MKVIGGSCRGRKLFVPKGSRERPTSDRIREALFNLLRDVKGLRILDLCAGTGAVGIEALSRGAARAVFVESDRPMAEALRRNVRECGLEEVSEILETDVRTGIRLLARREIRFDVIFADPPYTRRLVGEVLDGLARHPLLVNGGRLVIQHSIREEAGGTAAAGWHLADSRRYGDTLLSFYEDPSCGESNP